MSSQWIASHISKAIGIPEADVLEQIVPQLNSLTSKSEVEETLYGICGTDAPVLAFVTTYTRSRFPPSITPSAMPSRSHSTAVSRNASPSNSRPPTPSGGRRSNLTRGRAADLAPVPPPMKSRPVRKLERLIARLDKMKFGTDFAAQEDEEGQEADVEELKGCFCQARMHPLSHYTPICPSCGLVLCSLQLPNLPCPSCTKPLLNTVSRERVKRKIQDEINDILSREQAEKDRLEEEERRRLEAESGGGLFPTLGNAQVKTSKADTATRRVLTIAQATGPKGRTKVTTPVAATLTTYRPKVPLSQAAQDALLDREERQKLGRIERPFCYELEPPHERAQREQRAQQNANWKVKQGRLWGDIDLESQGLAFHYVSAGQNVKEEALLDDVTPRTKPVIPGAEIKIPKAKGKEKKTPNSQGDRTPSLKNEAKTSAQPEVSDVKRKA